MANLQVKYQDICTGITVRHNLLNRIKPNHVASHQLNITSNF